MLPRIVGVKYLGHYLLELTFNTGESGRVNFSSDLPKFRGVLSPLANMHFFAQAKVDSDSGTLGWPGEIDLDPDVLYSRATGAPLPEFATAA